MWLNCLVLLLLLRAVHAQSLTHRDYYVHTLTPSDHATLQPRQQSSSTAAASSTASSSGSSSASTTGSSSSSDSTGAAGGVSMISPNPTSSTSYYKIWSDSPITFSWSLTSVSESPSSLTVMAYCADNSQTYYVSPETGLAGSDTEVVWNPANDTNDAYPQASYTLRIFDERGWTATAEAGRVSPYAGSIFGLYSPGTYTSLADGWTCVACTGAGIPLAVPSLLVSFGVSVAAAYFLYNRGA